MRVLIKMTMYHNVLLTINKMCAYRVGTTAHVASATIMLILSTLSYPLLAQTEPDKSRLLSAQAQARVAQQSNAESPDDDPATGLVPPQSNTQTRTSGQPILRLEDTIRGNKEQPQVLTIVPWQLPVHQRINEGSEWQLNVKPLPAVERSAFLRNLAVVKELNAAEAAAKKADDK